MIPKKKNNLFSAKTFMVWFFIIIMTFSIGGYFISETGFGTQTVTYNNFNIYQEGTNWNLKLNGKIYSFTYLPTQLENISVDKNSFPLIDKKTVYITFDANQINLETADIVRYEMKRDFPKYFDIYPIDSMISSSNVYNLPIMTCDNSTLEYPVIYLKTNDEKLENDIGKIYVQNNCVIMESPSNNFLMLKDRFVYYNIGVMK